MSTSLSKHSDGEPTRNRGTHRHTAKPGAGLASIGISDKAAVGDTKRNDRFDAGLPVRLFELDDGELIAAGWPDSREAAL